MVEPLTLHLGELVSDGRAIRLLVPTNRKWWQFWKPSHEYKTFEVGSR